MSVYLRLAGHFLHVRAWSRIGTRRTASPLAPLIVAVILAGCQRPREQQETTGPSGEILVSAAVSLKEAFTEIATDYETANRVKVAFNFGGSGELQKQIEFGAPADVFASAGEREMDELVRKGMIVPESRADFAENTLVLIVPGAPGSPPSSLPDLAQPRFRRIAIGNPQTVPAGQYAQEALENNHLWDAVRGRVIMAENVRQVLEYVARGEVDAGLVYSTDVRVAAGRVKLVAVAPKGTYGPIRYPIAVVKSSQRRGAARAFLDFVLGTDGQRILRKHGFAPVG